MLAAIRQQAITWIGTDQDLRHMASTILTSLSIQFTQTEHSLSKLAQIKSLTPINNIYTVKPLI